MSIQALADKLQEPEFAGLTQDEKIDAINNLTVVVHGPIPVPEIVTYGIREGFWADVEMGKQDPDYAKRKLCINVIEWMRTKSIVDLEDPAADMMFQALLGFGFITQDQADAIAAMADKTVRWVDHIGLGTVGIGYLAQAERL